VDTRRRLPLLSAQYTLGSCSLGNLELSILDGDLLQHSIGKRLSNDQTMLQPRIPFRSLCKSCQLRTPLLRRNYAQVIETTPSTPEPLIADLPLTQADDRNTLSKFEVRLRRYTPRTPGIRHLVRPLNEHLWKGRPHHPLTFPKKGHGKGGRNNTGHVVVRHRGGGHKRRIRVVDFNRHAAGKHLVERIEHDPGRTAHIALIKNLATGERSYILAAEGLRAGDTVESYRQGIPEQLIQEMGGRIDHGVLASKTAHRGNCLQLGMIPVGTPVFNITPTKDDFGKICRSAGSHGIIVGKGEDTVQKEMIKLFGDTGNMDLSVLTPEQLAKFEEAANYVTIRLSSGEVRLVDKAAVATIGIASNVNFKYAQMGKAGRARWLNIRPTVRGLAMNAMDHPHGGGRGKSKGNVIPSSPWGKQVSGIRGVARRSMLTVPNRPNPGRRREINTRKTAWSSRSVRETRDGGGEVMRRADRVQHRGRLSGHQAMRQAILLQCHCITMQPHYQCHAEYFVLSYESISVLQG
jgi:ribosomal protein L2